MAAKDWKSLLLELREHAPTVLPVRVYVRDLKGHYLATTELKFKNNKSNHFVITLDKSLVSNFDIVRHFLVHEWAHAVSWREGDTICDHDPEWGLALSRIYQEVIDR